MKSAGMSREGYFNNIYTMKTQFWGMESKHQFIHGRLSPKKSIPTCSRLAIQRRGRRSTDGDACAEQNARTA